MRVLAQAVRFVLVGTAGTAAYAALYLQLRMRLADPVALPLAWLVSTLATNLVHRLVTFGVRERRGRAADAVVFLATSLIGLGLTTALLSVTAGAAGQVALIVVATGVAGVLRFVLMHAWLRVRGCRTPGTQQTPGLDPGA